MVKKADYNYESNVNTRMLLIFEGRCLKHTKRFSLKGYSLHNNQQYLTILSDKPTSKLLDSLQKKLSPYRHP